MKRKLSIILFLFSFFYGNAFAIENCEEITISSHPNYPPFHWEDNNKLTGASIYISEEIFKSLNVKVNTKYLGDWENVLKLSKENQIDFIPALKESKERKKYLTFSNIDFARNPVAVFVRKGESDNVRELEDLKYKRGSINKGDNHGKYIDKFINEQRKIKRSGDTVDNFKKLYKKETDYFIMGYLSGMDYILSNKLNNEYEVALKFEGEKVHTAFTKKFASKCPKVVKKFEEKLKEYKNNKEILNAILKYNKISLAKKENKN